MDFSKCMKNKCKDCRLAVKCFEYKGPKKKRGGTNGKINSKTKKIC